MSSILITSLPARSDCYQDGQKVIASCKSALAAKDLQINDENKTISDLQRALSDSNARVNAEDHALSEWYHNPVITIGLGILTGGLAVSLIKK